MDGSELARTDSQTGPGCSGTYELADRTLPGKKTLLDVKLHRFLWYSREREVAYDDW